MNRDRSAIPNKVPPPLGAEARLQHESRVLQLISAEQAFEDTLGALIRSVEAQSSEMWCSILLLDADRRRLRYGAAPSLPAEFRRRIEEMLADETLDPRRAAAFQRDQVCVADIATDPLWARDRAIALRHGLHTCWSKPIVDGERRLLGVFAVYYGRSRAPQAGDLWLVEIAAHGAAIVILRHEDAKRMRRWADVALQQENRLQSLKGEVNGLLATLGRPDRYASESHP